MKEMKKWIVDARVPLGMLLVQVIATGLQILSRVILSEGIFIFALMVYRNVVAAFAVAPLALFFERGALKKFTLAAFFWLFIVALTGICMAMGLFYYGLKDTTATYASNFLNLIPVVTFLFSTILRIERLGLRSKSGVIKSIGAMICLGGALCIALYKGKSVILTHHHQTPKNMTRGTIFLVSSCVSYGFWFITQFMYAFKNSIRSTSVAEIGLVGQPGRKRETKVKLFKVFPYKYWATLLTCIMASIQATVIGVCIDRKPKSWRLGWNLQLLTIFYSGILATAVTFSLLSMAITQKGPTYPSMFNPLALILIAIIEALFLGEDLFLGSLMGMCLIIVGLYSFLWGKNKEMKDSLPILKETSGGGGVGGGGGGDDRKATSSESSRLQLSATIVPAVSHTGD